MYTLVDGYNLLHAVGFAGRLDAPGNLERARIVMLDKLATYLTPEQRKQTIIIFDAGRRSQDRPQQYVRHDIRVEFAYDFDDADSMIELLIKKHSVPQKLLVVSSDHRIQNAARRRQAQFVDSDVWIDKLESPPDTSSRGSREPAKPKLREDTEYWMQLFDSQEIQEMVELDGIGSESEPDQPGSESSSSGSSSSETADEKDVGSDYNPFPDGYGEDLID